MRPSFLMMTLAGLIVLVAMGLAPSPPAYTGMPMVLVLLCFVALYGVTLVRSHGYWEQWSGPLDTSATARTVLIAVLQACVLVSFVVVVAVMFKWRSWEIAPLLVLALALNVLGLVRSRREREERPPPFPGPVVVGWPEHAPPTQGWVPVRILLTAQEAPASFSPGLRFHLDGVPIARPWPRGTFVLGVPPGPHRLQTVVGGRVGAPLDFVAEADRAVHLVLARRAGGPAWWPSPWELTPVTPQGRP